MGKSDMERIRAMGHRAFVGGDGAMWDEIAALQLSFLQSQGLREMHTLVDVACGSLRAGRLFIEYLDAGNYLGIDKEINLIVHGVAEELGIRSFVEKQPTFVVSGDFEFQKFPRRPDYAIAQSLLTHLTAEDIYRCFRALRKFIAEEGKFYATFFETNLPVENLPASDAIDCFFYTRTQIQQLAELTGWRMQYIGEWGHPRQQMMVKLEPK
ncbi:MAG TPA: class I SAM-dependent methyltransferase [Gallionella sp.]|nr:class I SAM-dependent methyltransferase [Gallionella sp.]